jgi:hypothetical protein
MADMETTATDTDTVPVPVQRMTEKQIIIQTLVYFLERTIQVMANDVRYKTVCPIVIDCIPSSYKFERLLIQPDFAHIVKKIATDIYNDAGIQRLIRKGKKLIDDEVERMEHDREMDEYDTTAYDIQIDAEERYDLSVKAMNRFIHITGWNEFNYLSQDSYTNIMEGFTSCLV